MKLNCEIIKSQNPQDQSQANPNLTLIHGWGSQNSIWIDWATNYLAPNFTLHLIELPGFGKSPEFSKKTLSASSLSVSEAWLTALAESLPQKTHLLGWSLGGILSQRLALDYPEKVQSLICMASTPRFTQLDGWSHAVSPSLLANFIKASSMEYTNVLKQFWRLQLQGSKNARPLMKKLMVHMTSRKLPKVSGMSQGLSLLRDLDNREIIHTLAQPTLWLLGEFDPLIPQALVKDLANLQPQAQVTIIKDASHIPFFSHPEETATEILNFLPKNLNKDLIPLGIKD